MSERDDENRVLVVTSTQVGRQPSIHIWDSESCTAIGRCADFHSKAVAALAFSADGRQLVSVGSDPLHTIALWVSFNGQFNGLVDY